MKEKVEQMDNNSVMKPWTPETHDSYIGIMRSEVDKLRAERDHYKKTLEELAHSSPHTPMNPLHSITHDGITHPVGEVKKSGELKP